MKKKKIKNLRKFWRELVEAAFERIRTKSKKDAYPKG